jgi:hypothetical protein
MDKISTEKAQALLKTAGATIRDQNEEIVDLRQKLAAKNREDRVRGVANMMEEKELAPDLTFEQKLAHVRDAGNLEAVEEAVKLATPQGFVFGDEGDIPSAAGGDPAARFEAFVLTGDDQD